MRDEEVVPTSLRISLPALDASTRVSLAFKRLRMPSQEETTLLKETHTCDWILKKNSEMARTAPYGPRTRQPGGDNRWGIAAILKVRAKGCCQAYPQSPRSSSKG